jgi:hypothetical protein
MFDNEEYQGFFSANVQQGEPTMHTDPSRQIPWARRAALVATLLLIAAQIGLLFWPTPAAPTETFEQSVAALGQQRAWQQTMQFIHACIFASWSGMFLTLMLIVRYERGLLRSKAVILVPLLGLVALPLVLGGLVLLS